MNQKWQVILAGSGGQGLILGGILLAKAAILDGKNVVQTQSYGIQSRGGYSQTEIVIGSDDILYPKCNKPNLVLALTQEAYDRYSEKVIEDCIILYNEGVVKISRDKNDIPFPYSEKSLDLGNEKLINSLALGTVLRHLQVVNPSSMEKAIEDELSPKIININIEAFRIGLEG